MTARRAVLSAALAILCGCSAPGTQASKGGGAREVSVAAASDLKFALDEVIAEFGRLHPDIRIKASYGSSGNYYSQLSNHAPFDVFLSADLDFPRRLAAQGLTLDAEFAYGVGRLVVWVPASSAIDVQKLGIEALGDPGVAHIAIANPQHAPYGRAAEAALRSMSVYDAIRGKLVMGDNIAQTLQFVQSGNAEIGLVALSLADAPTVRKQGRYWEVPLHRYPRIEQRGVILKWAKDPDAARAFRGFLVDRRGRDILKKFGFLPPEE